MAASVISAPSLAHGEPWAPEWTVQVGRSVEAVATDAGGNVYVTGSVQAPGDYAFSMVTARYGADGTEVWRHTWSPRAEGFVHAIGTALAVSPNGGTIYVAGAAMNDSTEVAKPRLWAYTRDGDLGWVRTVWPPSVMPSGVAATSDGAVVVGTTYGEYSCNLDGRIASLSADGRERWTSPFEAPGIPRATQDAVGDVASDHGRIYVVGSVDRRTLTCDEIMGEGRWADQDVVIQRLTHRGWVAWTRVLADPGVKDRDTAYAVDVVDPWIVVAGYAGGGNAGSPVRAWLASIAPTGTIRWSEMWAHAGRGAVANGVAIGPKGEIVAAGRTAGDLFVRTYSNLGSLLTRRSLRHSSASDVATSPDPTIYVVGRRFLWRLPTATA